MDVHTTMQQAFPALRDLVVLILVPYLVTLLRRVAKNGAVRDALAEIVENTVLCVEDAEQSVVRDAKDPSKPGVKWSAALAAEVKAKVIEDVRTISEAAVQTLLESGRFDLAKITLVIGKQIEKHKLSMARPSPATPPTPIPPAASLAIVPSPKEAA